MRFLVILMIVLPLGCRQEETLPSPAISTAQTDATRTGVGNVSPANVTAEEGKVIPVGGPQLAEKILLGSQLGDDKAVALEERSVPAGKPIHLTFRLKGAPYGLALRAVWMDEAGKTLEDQRLEVAENAKIGTITSAAAASWKPGKYKVQPYLGGDEQPVVTFEIVPAAAKTGS